MSRAVNKVILIGRVGADPELRYTSAGIPVLNLSLATNESFTNREGERTERTDWHRLVLWRQLAELAGQHLSKGSLVYVEGTLRYRTWTDQAGQERFSAEIEVRELTMLDRRETGATAPVAGGNGKEAAPVTAGQDGRAAGPNPPGPCERESVPQGQPDDGGAQAVAELARAEPIGVRSGSKENRQRVTEALSLP